MQNQNQLAVVLVGLLFMINLGSTYKVVAQSLTISGTVIDENTGEPLAYATVAIKEEAVGTITNLAGEFDFHIPEVFSDKQFVVSTLGYVDFTAKVGEVLSHRILLVKLRPGRTILDEVLVTEELSAGDLLKIALLRIEENYPMVPVEMDAFYRDTKKVDGEYVGLLEAAVKIYDKDYSLPRDHTKLRERVSLIEVRRTLEYDYGLEKYFDKYNVLEDLLLENLVKYRTFNNEEEFYANLLRKKVPGYNNSPINMVFMDLPGYSLKIYIDENYGIRKIIFGWGDGIKPIYNYRKSGKLENQVMRQEKQIEFQEYKGKLFLKYIAAHYQNNWFALGEKDLILTTERDQTLLINKINTENPLWISNSKTMKRYGLQFQHKTYNKEFWQTYNSIKDMPLNDQAYLDLERLFTLEEQFESFE